MCDLHRRDPDDVDTKVFQVVDLAQDPGDVSESISVGVLEGRGVNLVANGVLPPRLCRGARHG